MTVRDRPAKSDRSPGGGGFGRSLRPHQPRLAPLITLGSAISAEVSGSRGRKQTGIPLSPARRAQAGHGNQGDRDDHPTRGGPTRGLRHRSARGVSRRWVDNLVRRGVLRRAAPGVYVLRRLARHVEPPVDGGAAGAGDESWVSHDAAAKLHKLDRAPADAVEFTVPRGSTRAAHAIHRPHDGGPPQARSRHGRRVPLPVGHAHDHRPRPRWGARHPSGGRDRQCGAARVDVASGRGDPTRRAARARSVGCSRPRSAPRRLRWTLDAGAPVPPARSAGRAARPAVQVIHRRDGRTFARVDFLFEPLGVVVEVSGRLGHSSPAERARDAQRRNELQDVGRKVYEYTYDDVMRRSRHVEETLLTRLHDAGWRR